jgi:hypothetical protein
MNVTITGTILDPQTYASSLFSLKFDLTGGRLIKASCDSATMGMAVTDFSGSIDNLRVGSTPVPAPQDFSANMATVTCGQVYQEFVSGPLILESKGYLLQPNAIIFDGSVGSWWIEAAKVQITSVPEPSCALLLLLGIVLAAVGRRPVLTARSLSSL